MDESELWPDGRFVTTHLVVRTEFLRDYPGTVRKLLDGHLAAIDAVNDDPEAAKERLNAGLEALSGKPLADPVLDAAWENLEFTADPVASSLFGSAEHAEAVGLLEPVDLGGIYDLSLLNAALEAAGEPTVDQP